MPLQFYLNKKNVADLLAKPKSQGLEHDQMPTAEQTIPREPSSQRDESYSTQSGILQVPAS